jgi:hypothetical protein
MAEIQTTTKKGTWGERLLNMLIAGGMDAAVGGTILSIVHGWQDKSGQALTKLSEALHGHADPEVKEALGHFAVLIGLADEMRILRDIAMLYDEGKISIEAAATLFRYLRRGLTQGKRTRFRKAYVTESVRSHRHMTLLLLVNAAVEDARDQNTARQAVIDDPHSHVSGLFNAWPRTDEKMKDFLTGSGMLDHTPLDTLREIANNADARARLYIAKLQRNRARHRSPGKRAWKNILALLTGRIFSIGGEK